MGLAFHILRNARLAPPWIEADKLVRRSIDEMDQLVAQAGADGLHQRDGAVLARAEVDTATHQRLGRVDPARCGQQFSQ